MVNSINNSGRMTMGGLATGLDTQSIIKQLTYATRLKIDTKKQSIQSLQWKTDIYREITTSLNSFKDKYFSFSSKTNLLSSSLYTNGKINCTSPYVSITGNPSAAQNIIIKDIQQLASKTTIKTNGSIADSSINSGSIVLDKQVNNLAGESITISYNSKNYTVRFDENFTSTDPTEISNYINDKLKQNTSLVDESGALKISVSVAQGTQADTQAFTITNNTADGKTVKIAAGTTSALTALGFSVSDSSTTTVTSKDVTAANFTSTLNLSQTLKGSYIKLNLDGVEKTISFNDLDFDIQSTDQLASYLNGKIEQSFPGGKVAVTAQGDKLVIKTSSDNSILSVTGAGENILGAKGVLGLEINQSNRIDVNKPISELDFNSPLVGDKFDININGQNFSFTKDTSINSIINTVNSSGCGVKMSYSTTMNKFMVESTTTGSASKIEINDVSGNLSQCLLGDNYTVTNGTDAVVVVSLDGGLTETVIERNSNSFSIDGVNITVNSMAAGDVAEDIKITVESNTDEIVSTFKSFVEDYNKIVEMMNSHVKTKPNNDYKPLTDEQKKEMSESEIALWEKKAKEGLLFADNDVNSLVSELKSSLTMVVEDSGLLSEFGISFDKHLNGGKLMLDETKFKKALSEAPDKLISTLTKKSTINKQDDYKAYCASSGVLNRISDVIDKYASVYQNKGILVSKAGVANTTTDKNNYLSRQIQSYNDQIKKLTRKLSMEESRYLRQFTSLETNINKLNSQSSMFTNGQM